MITTFTSAVLSQGKGAPIEVEVDSGPGFPGIYMVGLGDVAVHEARERVRSTLLAAGFHMPKGRVTVNLAPAHVRKEGPSFDVAMALGMVTATKQLEVTRTELVDPTVAYLGELRLTGQLKPVRGMLPMILALQKSGVKTMFVPMGMDNELALLAGLRIYEIADFKTLTKILAGQQSVPMLHDNPRPILRCPAKPLAGAGVDEVPRLEDVVGQEQAKRAVVLAAAGGHHVLFSGSPGGGKTMLAKALSGLLPPLQNRQLLEVAIIHSTAGRMYPGLAAHHPPFRSPHHTASYPAMVGGGQQVVPGEISLAHHGVLFLDELPEFCRPVLEALREPLEQRVVTIARAQGSVTFAADCLVLAAMNPCPCGFLLDEVKDCSCSPADIARYQRKVSGPLLDRLDLRVTVARVSAEALSKSVDDLRHKVRHQMTTAKAQLQVWQVRERQFQRNQGMLNGQLSHQQTKALCRPDSDALRLLSEATERMQLSARGFMRTLRVARTIADLENQTKIQAVHVAEALQFRG